MKKLLSLLLAMFLFSGIVFAGNQKTDSLLKMLDKIIQERSKYVTIKETKIQELKQKNAGVNDLRNKYNIQREIIEQYNSFLCDSAEFYINKNLSIAKKLNDGELILESSLRLFYIYSLSGLFLQASEIINSIEYNKLPNHFRAWYCWNYIRYYENLIFYTADSEFTKQYEAKKEGFRDEVMKILYDQSDEYKKELAHKLQLSGKYADAVSLLDPIFQKQQPGTHSYAMAAMNLAKVYKQEKNLEKEEYYLILAASTDVQLAVKDNEALLSLAIILYNKGDINRAYDYIRVALDDALFYNTRFKNSVIARVQPIIEDTYLQKIKSQQKNLSLYSIVISILVVFLTIGLIYIYKQVKVVSRARRELRAMNDNLLQLNHKLDEANIIKERYLGYFMNQCSIYINKLDTYRKNVNRKLKTGQIDSLYNSSNSELEKEIDELRTSFDKAFLKLYPNFVIEFNSLLKPQERYVLEEEGSLNTELRIFALIKLGITDVTQIADFLRYSPQTVYNYKSKVKGKSLVESDHFEEEVKKIGQLH
ncbi:MAG: hypothetical protein JXR27_05985 [Paludibacteraceae bacterium]|nr:hypothetical protein [Paludibacteraceae bacterium]